MRMRMLGLIMRLKGVDVYEVDSVGRMKRELTRPHNKVLVQLKPQVDREKDVFYKAGIALSNDFETIWGKGKGDADLFAGVSEPKRDGEHWLAVAPFARHKGKVYPGDQLERVIDYFSKRDNQKIFIFGFGEEERAEIARYARRYQGVVNVAEADLGLAAELSLLSHCDVMLSMDSANMHLASLAGTPVVSVWGSTIPQCGFLGYNQSTDNAVWLDLPCQPCSIAGTEKCPKGHFSCMMRLKPELIANTTMKLL